MKLSRSRQPFDRPHDARPHMPEPLPVSLVAVSDVRLLSNPGLDHQLDHCYVDLLGFARDADRNRLLYHSENFAIELDLFRPITHACAA